MGVVAAAALPEYSLVVPIYNEEETVPELVAKAPAENVALLNAMIDVDRPATATMMRTKTVLRNPRRPIKTTTRMTKTIRPMRPFDLSR